MGWSLVKRLVLLAVAACIVLPGCSFGGGGTHEFKADFSRAVQVFPAVKVRVLGVDVGQVVSVKNVPGAVQVTFRVAPDVKLPAGVQAAVVPMSLLGERYIQLFPAYRSGPTLSNGATIPESRTAVPAEPDELLRSLQDYMGGLDPQTVTAFIQNAAAILQGNGEDLNRLIEHGTSVVSTLSSKREDLATLIVELNKLTLALASRQQALGQLIQNYDVVAGTLAQNRSALEGTITGLNDMETQLASLLVEHRLALGQDIETLTQTGRSLSRNVQALADTGRYATLLFEAASRAVDYNHGWLRLNNQGQELGALILLRLEQRLEDLCLQFGDLKCTTQQYWSQHVPQLFCFSQTCPKAHGNAGQSLAQALGDISGAQGQLDAQAQDHGGSMQDLANLLLEGTVGDPYGYGGFGPNGAPG